MKRWGIECVVLLIIVLTLSNCTETGKPRLQAPATRADLVPGMTLSEVKESMGEPWSDPAVFFNRSGQRIEQIGFELYETEKNESRGEKTQYWLYFLCTDPESYELIYWGEVAHWKKDVALLEKARFINSNLPFQFPKAESPVGIRLHHGMPMGEVEEAAGGLSRTPIVSPYTFVGKSGCFVELPVDIFKTVGDRALGKKTRYVLYFFYKDPRHEWRLAYWVESGDQEKARALLEKYGFK